MMVDLSFPCGLLIAAVFLVGPTASLGQSTIFNIPSADTTPRGSWGVEADFITKPVKYRNGGYQTYGYRVAYGVTNHTELGSNFYYIWDGHESAAQVEFSLKQRIYQNERHSVSATAGLLMSVPLRGRNDRSAMIVYGNASKTIGTLNGLSITGGVYHVFRGSRDYGTRTGAMLAVVQPIDQRFSLVADWFSGQNRLGYASAGLNYNITKRQYLLTGYSFGNSGRGNNAFAAYYGFTF